MRYALFLGALLATVPLFLVLYYVLVRAIPHLSLSFFTQLPAVVGEDGGGMAHAMLGTLILLALASGIGLPWGIAAGIYLSEFGETSSARVIRFATDMMTSVPSIVVGIFVYGLIVYRTGHFSAYAGGFALAVIMIPIVARSTEEVLKLVPQHVREAGLALGIPRWKVILFIVVRGSVGGMVTGSLLAIARVSGETAPLLFTALGNEYFVRSLSQPIASLPVQIFNYASSPYEQLRSHAWVGAFVLVSIVFGINLITRWWVSQKRLN